MAGIMEYTVWKSSLNHLSGTDDLLITYAKPQEKNTCNFAEISIFCFSKMNAIKQYYYSTVFHEPKPFLQHTICNHTISKCRVYRFKLSL